MEDEDNVLVSNLNVSSSFFMALFLWYVDCWI